MLRRWIVLSLSLLLLLQGCGFYLKGQQAVSPRLAGLKVDGYGQLATLIRRQIAELGGGQVSKPGPQVKLHVESEGFDSRVLTVDGSGKAIEYELHYKVSFRVDQGDGRPLLASEMLEMRRSYFSSGEDELGRQSEEDIIKQDMVAAMADRLFRQLEVQLK